MSRISTNGAHTYHVQQLLEVQYRLSREQVEVSTGKKSVDYAGLGGDALRLINIENDKSVRESYITTNDLTELRLKTMGDVINAASDAVLAFRNELIDFKMVDTRGESNIDTLQASALRTLKDLESYLNAEVVGQALFAGSRADASAVSLPFNSLSDFQERYDGYQVKYPTTRDAHIKKIETSTAVTGNLTFDSATGTITAANQGTLGAIPAGATITVADSTGNDRKFTVQSNTGSAITVAQTITTNAVAAGITFTASDGTTTFNASSTFTAPATVTAAVAGELASLAVGDTFTISGAADSANNGVFKVATNDGTTLTIDRIAITDETVGATLTMDSYYGGDTSVLAQRVSTDREVSYGVTAIDPALEKAIRALGIIAQGEFGTPGGLDQNQDRIEAAQFLLNDAVDGPASGTPPYGTEIRGDMNGLGTAIGLNYNLTATTTASHKTTITSIDALIIKIEDSDPTEAIVRLLDDQRALEASYQVLSKTSDLSLLQYLR